MMAMNLLVEDLKQVAAGPHGLDPDVLMTIQRTLMSQVMQLYREDYVKFNNELEGRGLDPEACRLERAALLTQLLQSEYRHRASNGQGFSLPMYVEVATNHYRMQIQQIGQAISEYVSLASHAAERHYTGVRGARWAESGVDALTQQVAEQLDKLESALEGLSRVAKSDVPLRDLRASLERVFADARKDSFSAALVEDAQTLAAARSYERKHGLGGEADTYLHGMK